MRAMMQPISHQLHCDLPLMLNRHFRRICLIALLLSPVGGWLHLAAQRQLKSSPAEIRNDARAQLPGWMQPVYLDLSYGLLHYPFSEQQLEPGYELTSLHNPPAAIKLGAGYRFNPYLSAQLSYLFPTAWVEYTYRFGDRDITRPIWTNVGAAGLVGTIPLASRWSASLELGTALMTRKGFRDPEQQQVVNDASFVTLYTGANLRYHLSESFGIQLQGNYMPASAKHRHPSTLFAGGGVSYRLQPLSTEQLAKTARSGRNYPHQWVQLGYSSNAVGYGINDFFSGEVLRIFWGGSVPVQQGISLQYQRNVFHTARWFAVDLALNASWWEAQPTQESVQPEQFITLSVAPVFRVNVLYTPVADAYLFYSVAGPSYISSTKVNGFDLGTRFVFMDTMGAGLFFGTSRQYNAEFKIGHYSNGNLFPQNAGVKVPLALHLGYAW